MNSNTTARDFDVDVARVSSPNLGPPDSPILPSHHADDTQSEPIDIPDEDLEEEEIAAVSTGAEERKDTKTKKEKAIFDPTRAPGKSHLPFSRVQRILKADRELPVISREATFLISVAAEEFVKKMSGETSRLAEKERRTTVQQRDAALLVRRADQFAFLEEIIEWPEPEQLARKKPEALLRKKKTGLSGPLDSFLGRDANSEEESPPESATNIVMNEDGTMSIDS